MSTPVGKSPNSFCLYNSSGLRSFGKRNMSETSHVQCCSSTLVTRRCKSSSWALQWTLKRVQTRAVQVVERAWVKTQVHPSTHSIGCVWKVKSRRPPTSRKEPFINLRCKANSTSWSCETSSASLLLLHREHRNRRPAREFDLQLIRFSFSSSALPTSLHYKESVHRKTMENLDFSNTKAESTLWQLLSERPRQLEWSHHWHHQLPQALLKHLRIESGSENCFNTLTAGWRMYFMAFWYVIEDGLLITAWANRMTCPPSQAQSVLGCTIIFKPAPLGLPREYLKCCFNLWVTAPGSPKCSKAASSKVAWPRFVLRPAAWRSEMRVTWEVFFQRLAKLEIPKNRNHLSHLVHVKKAQLHPRQGPGDIRKTMTVAVAMMCYDALMILFSNVLVEVC